MSSSRRQARRVQDVGAGLLEGPQAGDRVVEIAAVVDVVLRARGQHQVHGTGVRGGGRRGDALVASLSG